MSATSAWMRGGMASARSLVWCLAATVSLAGCAPEPSDRRTGEAEAAHVEAYRQLIQEHRATLEQETLALREELRLLHDERIAARRGRIALIAERYEGEVRAYDVISLANRCRVVVSVALYYLDLDDRWITRGWWNLDPGAIVETDAKTRNSVLYFYAENRAEGRSWTGDGRDDSLTLSVVDNRFDHLDDDRWAYDEPRKVSFFRRDTGEDWIDHVETFDCPLEAPLPPPRKVEASPPADQPAPGRSRPLEAPPS